MSDIITEDPTSQHTHWALIPGYPDYRISRTGQVYSYLKTGSHTRRSHPRLIKGTATPNGPLQVCLTSPTGHRKFYRIPFLLSLTFSPDTEPKETTLDT